TARPGDNLFSNSTLALDADTGDVSWYFQYTPNDAWDYDEVGTMQLMNVNGVSTVGHFARNGFYYDLDATDGTFLHVSQYVDQVTWTDGIDEKTGLPVEYDPNLAIQTYVPAVRPDADGNNLFCPNLQGGTNMFPTSYSHRTGLVYASAIEGCSAQGDRVGDPATAIQTGSVTAVDPATGQVVVKADLPWVAYGGQVSTAGGLVFGSTINGDFFAMDDETLEILWNINLGSSIEAPPISFEVNGQQMIALAVGPGGVVMNFMRYGAAADDPRAAEIGNQQRTSTMYFFTLP
ncbi:MAG: outer membrane protein assembly factor BamB family protein, partial [Alphaproteobacteria bacterium]